MVGDRTGDILAGERTGAQTILLNTGCAGKDLCYVVPNFVAISASC